MSNAITASDRHQIPNLPRSELLRLGKISSWRFMLALAADILVIAGAIAGSELIRFNIVIYLISTIVIGSRLHAIGVLLHDCAHYRAFRNRRMNLIVGEIIAWTIGTTAEGYRKHHIQHHRYLNSPQDPDWHRKANQKAFHFPKARPAFFQTLIFQASGLGMADLFMRMKRSAEMNDISKNVKVGRLCFYSFLLSASLATGMVKELALYWLVPMLTSFSFFFYIRSALEHHGALDYSDAHNSSRTTIPRAWERIFLPHHVGYHLEHHLYPHVPFYRLPDLHRQLIQDTIYHEKAHITNGLFAGLSQEFIRSQNVAAH